MSGMQVPAVDGSTTASKGDTTPRPGEADLPGMFRAVNAGLIDRARVETLYKCWSQHPEHEMANAFDLSRVLIEEACRAILRQRNHRSAGEWDIPKKLLPATLETLNVTSEEHDGTADTRLRDLAMGIGALSDAIGQTAKAVDVLRHTEGFSSHAGFTWATHEEPQVDLVVRGTDVLVGFLTDVHCRYPRPPGYHRPEYDEHEEKNESFDALFAPFTVETVDGPFTYPASVVLFAVDPTAYRDLVLSADQLDDDPDAVGEDGVTA